MLLNPSAFTPYKYRMVGQESHFREGLGQNEFLAQRGALTEKHVTPTSTHSYPIHCSCA